MSDDHEDEGGFGSLEEALGAAMRHATGRQHRPKSSILPEAAVARLTEAYDRYGKTPFKVGELVTPRSDSGYEGAGDPMIVLEVREGGEAHRNFREERMVGSNWYGQLLDVRVLGIDPRSDQMETYWMESFRLEPYVLTQKGFAS